MPATLRLPGFALAQLGRVTRAAIKDAFAEQGLSFRAHFVLLCLSESGELSQRELAELIAMDRSDLVKVLDGLEGSGYLRRVADRNDRRRHILSITTLGRRTLAKGVLIPETATSDVLSRLTPAQQATLHRLVLRALGW